MRKFVLVGALAATLLAPGAALAQSYSSTQVGDSVYTYGSDGSSAVTTQVGQSTYTNWSDGSSYTSTQVGDTTYTNQTSAPSTGYYSP